MKISQATLHQIIKEELYKTLLEAEDWGSTQKLDPREVEREISRDLSPENRRPEAMRIFKQHIEPFYSENDLEVLVGRDDDEIGDTLSQIIGWFHPAFQDKRGRPNYDNPSRLGLKVAREFIEEDLDFVQHAQEFVNRLEKYIYDEAKVEFAGAKAWAAKNPARNVKVGRTATPGTEEYESMQKMLQKVAAEKEASKPGNTGRLIRK